MELALVWYIVLNLVIFAFVLLFVRAARGRVVPHEPQDLEENALVNADWDLVRRERCLPSHCRRLMGQPLRPRKDVTCEICAATFLEVRLRRILDGPLAGERIVPKAAEGMRSEGAVRPELPASPVFRRSSQSPDDLRNIALPGSHPGRRPAASAPRRERGWCRWASACFYLGIGCTVAGAAVAAFGGLLWLILPGYGMVLIGLGLIISGSMSGAV